jgi:LacI family transcriptional regulator
MTLRQDDSMPEHEFNTGTATGDGQRAQRPTLKTIAYMTGLGITTVSRALNDASDIGAETKKRVRLVADQIGYRPNRAGVRLRTGKTNVLSLILALDEEVLGLTSQLVLGISEAVANTGYHLVVTPYDRSKDPLEPVRYVVETESADGVILSSTQDQDPRVQYLLERNFPVATHGRTGLGPTHPYYDFDNETYARKGVELLHSRGRTRLGLIAPPAMYLFSQHMTKGFVDAMERFELLEIPIRSIHIDTPYDILQAEIERLMRSRHRPDGLICGNGSSALTAAVAIEAAGLKLGVDVDIVTKHSADLIRRVRPEIFAINEDFRKAGNHLARSLMETIAGKSAADLQYLEVPK